MGLVATGRQRGHTVPTPSCLLAGSEFVMTAVNIPDMLVVRAFMSAWAITL